MAAATLRFIEEQRGRLLLHSGGVAAADGRVVVVHGRSGSGKTTLTTALVAGGLAYLTDETVCLDPDTLAVTPFPKPLTVKPGSQRLLRRLRPDKDRIDPTSGNWQVDPASLGDPPIPDGPLQPALIVFPDFQAGRAGVAVEPVSRARAAFVLGEQTSALWAVEPRPLAALARLVGQAPAYQLSYGDAHDAVPVIAGDLLPEASPGPATPPAEPPARPDAAGSGLRWASGVDWVGLAGEAVLFDGRHLHHLDVPGAATWALLDGTRTLPEVAAVLADAFGADPSRVLLDVEDLARVLTRHGLLTGG